MMELKISSLSLTTPYPTSETVYDLYFILYFTVLYCVLIIVYYISCVL